jgi:hypothetical protein
MGCIIFLLLIRTNNSEGMCGLRHSQCHSGPNEEIHSIETYKLQLKLTIETYNGTEKLTIETHSVTETILQSYSR